MKNTRLSKITIDFIKEYSLKYNTVCISTEYINAHEKLKFICPENHEYSKNWNKFYFGERCKICSKKMPPTIEYIKEFALKDDTICESKQCDYINNESKLKFICPLGHEYNCNWANFRIGNRCSICSPTKKKTIEEIKEYALLDGTQCISDTYIYKEKLNFICPKGHHYSKLQASFYQGERCKKCYYDNNTGPNNPSYKGDYTRKGRIKYLNFDLKSYKFLSDDPNYEEYLLYKEKVKNKEIQTNIYQVDHIQPRVAFIDNNLDNIYGALFIKRICNLRENVRIISEKDNKSKSFKYNQQDFLDWFNLKLKEQQEFL